MSLLGTVTEENYYNGSQTFIVAAGSDISSGFTLTFNPLPTAGQVRLFIDNVEFPHFNISGATLTISGSPFGSTNEQSISKKTAAEKERSLGVDGGVVEVKL